VTYPFPKDPPPDEERCVAQTADGERCKKGRMDNSKYCHIHQKNSAQKQTKFTKEKKEVFLRALTEGKALSIEVAAAIAGISKPTVYNHADPEHSSYDEDFAARFERARDIRKQEYEEAARKSALGEYGEKPYWPALRFMLTNLSDEWKGEKKQEINLSQSQQQKQEENSVDYDKAKDQLEELLDDRDN